MKQIRKAQQEAEAATGGADIFSEDITVERDGTLRAWLALGTDGVFSLVIKSKLGTEVLAVVNFDLGDPVAANDARVFDFASRSDRSYNYRTSVTGDVTLYVDQLEGQF